jgi:hypothetical protein
MVNLPSLTPVNVVGVVSGTLAEGVPTSVFSSAVVQDVYIVNSEPLELLLNTTTGPLMTFTYGSDGTLTSPTAENFFSWNSADWAVLRNGSIIGISLYTEVNSQSVAGTFNIIAQTAPIGEAFTNRLIGTATTNGTGFLSVVASGTKGEFPVSAGDRVRFRLTFGTFEGTLAASNGIILVEVD